jgi:hypothetical protein
MLYPETARILPRAAPVNDAALAIVIRLNDDTRHRQLLGYPEPGQNRLRAGDRARASKLALGSTDRRGHQRQRRSQTREQGPPLRAAIRLCAASGRHYAPLRDTGRSEIHDRFWICISRPAMGRGAATAGRNAGGEGGNRTQCRRTRRCMERTDLVDGRRGTDAINRRRNTQGRAENLPKMRARRPTPQVSDARRCLPHDPGGFPDGPERR